MTASLPPSESLFAPGDNCHAVADFARFALLIDGEAYFTALEQALSQAQRRIVILGWDFNSQIRLRPDHGGRGQTLGDYLRVLVEAKPALEVHLLIWRNSIFYGANVDLPLPLTPRWSDHPRIHFKLDDAHPWGACHHQKIFCVDGSLAFTGGVDLTQGRWDTPDHQPEHPLRVKDGGEAYRPVHDVQAMIDGPAAEVIMAIAAQRWEAAGGEALAPLAPLAAPWPAHVAPMLTDHAAAIARTLPAYEGQGDVTEIRNLNRDLLLAAERSIYIESQYFAVPEVAEILAWHLGRLNGPDVVLVINAESNGMLEQYVMANNRDRMFALLRHADKYGRLRTYHPVCGPELECQIKTHSKLMIVDDRYLRVGSSNFNSRSLGLDTECDLALEGSTEAARQAIARTQALLLGEHLGIPAVKFTRTLARCGSLIEAIESFNQGAGQQGRRLTPYPDLPPDTEMSLAPGSSLLDPDRPIDLAYLWDKLTSSSP
jgi:phosphatidylserine/phosphatidylglycerophosphate/cardiolipin synthase-like enzyme